MKDSISISETAKLQIKKHLAKLDNPNSYLRIGLRGGGCEGFKYVIQFDDNIYEKDTIIEEDSIKILIDHKSLSYLKGASLDWHHNLMGQGFVILNPLEESKCGCGQSFSLKKG